MKFLKAGDAGDIFHERESPGGEADPGGIDAGSMSLDELMAILGGKRSSPDDNHEGEEESPFMQESGAMDDLMAQIQSTTTDAFSETSDVRNADYEDFEYAPDLPNSMDHYLPPPMRDPDDGIMPVSAALAQRRKNSWRNDMDLSEIIPAGGNAPISPVTMEDILIPSAPNIKGQKKKPANAWEAYQQDEELRSAGVSLGPEMERLDVNKMFADRRTDRSAKKIEEAYAAETRRGQAEIEALEDEVFEHLNSGTFKKLGIFINPNLPETWAPALKKLKAYQMVHDDTWNGFADYNSPYPKGSIRSPDRMVGEEHPAVRFPKLPPRLSARKALNKSFR